MKKAPKRSSESKRGPFVMAPLRQELEEELQVLAGEKLRPVVTHLVRPLEPLGGNRLHEKERPSETKRLPALVERAACLSRLDDRLRRKGAPWCGFAWESSRAWLGIRPQTARSRGGPARSGPGARDS